MGRGGGGGLARRKKKGKGDRTNRGIEAIGAKNGEGRERVGFMVGEKKTMQSWGGMQE